MDLHTYKTQAAPSEQNRIPALDEIQSWLITKLAEYLEVQPAAIDVRTPFATYGLDSIGAVGLSGDLEEWLKCELEPTLLYSYSTIASLSSYLAGVPAQAEGEPREAAMRPEVTAEPIAIIGMGCRFPGNAHSPEAFWQVLMQGISGISEIPAERWDVNAFYDPDPDASGKMYVRHGGFLRDISAFDAQFFGISPREAVRMDPQQRLLIEVAWEALERAGQPVRSLAGSQTGVFIGMMGNQEYTQLQAKTAEPTYIDDPYFGIGGSASIASGRLAYLFDLRGPTLAVDTACSSSLVAVHLACQSLRSGECNLALVGGVNTITLADNVVNACKMRMLAPDGRCKTFDAAADGFVLGEGCGMVVLKRLSEAVANKDNILAVIRGSAVNQDGRSNGITAPNQLAQQEVIQKALSNAGIHPQSVSYVEAHGSGTVLGDPIEIGALTATIAAHHSAEMPLKVGTVKTNIGHLAGAAGIAGLIKTILALQHKQIPPHLNLTELNPHIAWNTLPIEIPTHLTEWVVRGEPRIAGVSSFGWSGTNAHVLLEEAPPVEPPTESKTDPSSQLLLLSAKTDEALDMATDNLLTYLKEHPQVALSDVAYTSQLGRSAFEHRRVLLSTSSDDALATLQHRDAQRILQNVTGNSSPSVIFLFPGLGDQYQNMTRELYFTEPVFRNCVDTCCEQLHPYLKTDLRELLYPDTTSISAESPLITSAPKANASLNIRLQKRFSRDETATVRTVQEGAKLNQTVFAQPALFVIEYALAQLWISWGIRPQAMMGYSLGEYVAACISGVLSLEDALLLVVKRAQLIQNSLEGSMLAIALPEQEVHSLLGARLSLCAVNSAMMSVIGGTTQAIDEVERELTSKGIACMRVQTTHAFHSYMMKPLEASLIELVRRVPLHAPRIPYISNVTGTWITAEQAQDPRYWAQHMCQTVRCADGMNTLWQQSNPLFLEVGPGQALGSLALQHIAGKPQYKPLVFASLRHVYDKQRTDRDLLLSTLGRLWLEGVDIDWSGFHRSERRPIVPLPTYPFERQHYWIEGRQQTQQTVPSKHTSTRQKASLTDSFYVPLWKQARVFLPNELRNLDDSRQHWLVFCDTCGVAEALTQSLEDHNQDVTLVTIGQSFTRVRDGVYTIDPSGRNDYDALLKHLHLLNKKPHNILHLWNVTSSQEVQREMVQQRGFYSLLFLAQSLGSTHSDAPLQLFVISNGTQQVFNDEELCPGKATLLGAVKVIPKEYQNITCRSIDIATSGAGKVAAARLVPQLLTEVRALNVIEDVVALRGGSRWLQTFEALPLNEVSEYAIPLKKQGVYLVTGGLGGLGFSLANYLARTLQARVVLLSRSGLPPREQWGSWLKEHDADDGTSQKIKHIFMVEELGAEVLIVKANVADEQQMKRALETIHTHFGKINGVIHAAGVPGEGLIQLKTPEMVERVFEPKVTGTLVLDSLLQNEQLDFMMLYSSSNAVTGGFGEVDYSGANAFLDAFAHHARTRYGRPVTAVNWGPWQWDAWQSTLYATLPGVYARIKDVRDNYGLTFQEGEDAFRRILASSLAQVLVLPQGLQATFEQAASLSAFSLLEHVDEVASAKVLYARPNLRNAYIAPRNESEQRMAIIWQESLGVERVGVYDHFFELGGNSLIGMLVVSRIKKEFSIELSAASLFEGPTIDSLLQLLQPREQSAPVLEQNSSRGKLRRERLKKHKHNVHAREEELENE